MAEESTGDFEPVGELAQRIAQRLDQEPDLVALTEAAFRRGFLEGAKAAVYANWEKEAPSDSPEAIDWLNRLSAWKRGDSSVPQLPPMPFD